MQIATMWFAAWDYLHLRVVMQIVAMLFAAWQCLHLHSSMPVQTTRMHAGVNAEEP